MRRAARTDENHSAVRDGLRRCGYRVHDTHQLGEGFPDFLVGAPWGELFLLEVKNPDKPPSARQLTADEAEFHSRWRRFPVLVALTVEDAIDQMRRRRRPWSALARRHDRLRAVRRLLEENGCECTCDHHPDERGDDCEVCLACRIGEAVGK